MGSYEVRADVPEDVRGELKTYSDITQKLLFYRGITTRQEAERFLSPDFLRDTHDPFLLKDMEKAVERIYAAIDKNEKIVIYSDFDADGIPGAVVLRDFFRMINFDHVSVYIPHRHDEGFGVHLEAIDELAQDGARLIITVDCGIADAEAVEQARKHGVDVIVTDHHESPNGVPHAYAVVDHKQEDCSYPEEVLCGAGVAFKLVQALLAQRDFGIPKGKEKWLLDMVGIATCADMVPLVGENRALAFWGLYVLRKSPRPGIKTLCRKLGIKQQYMTEDDIGFMIAPRINAASRMGESMDAFHFLSATTEEEALSAYQNLHQLNEQRKGIVAGMIKTIRTKIEARESQREVIVAGSPDWKPSLLGLAANTLVEVYGKPVFLWGRDGKDVLKGSARSDGTVHLVTLMEHTQELFLGYGGHTMAGGFSLEVNNVHHLEEQLSDAYKKICTDSVDETKYIDAALPLTYVNEKTYRDIARFAPFGMGNEKPLFEFNNVVVDSFRAFGKTNNHFEIIVTQDGAKAKAIGFFMTAGSFSKTPIVGEPVTLIAHFEKSQFGWKPELRLRLVDIR